MLRFVLGRSGFGKTQYLRQKFSDLAQNGCDRLLFLVPDQISFETEAAFLDLLGPSLSRNILVLGFSRLCDYVFEATGNRFSAFADDGVCSLVMSLALEQVRDRLTLFDKRYDTADTREMMLSAVKEYKKCALLPDTLLELSDSIEDETLRKKLSDTAIVYSAYNAIMEKSYMDPLDALTKASDLLALNRLFEGYTVALDSFYGFTSQEYSAIERIMAMSKDMYVALTLENAYEDNLFFVPDRTMKRLKRLAKDNSVSIASPTVLDTPCRFKNEALIAVEKNVYRIEKELYTDSADCVTIYRAADRYDECDFVARSIRKLVENGCRYRDIAVIARSTDSYIGVLDTYLDKYNIRYFMDKPSGVDSMPIVRLVKSAFDVVVRGFDREDVLTLLKTGLCSYSVTDIADFENYVFVWDINRSGFFEPFSSPPTGFSDKVSDSDKLLLSRIEAMRADIIGTLKKFSDTVKNSSGKVICKALMTLLYDLKVDDNINSLCDALEKEEEHQTAADLIRMWNVLCALLDKTVAVIGDYEVSPKRFSELLYANINSSEIGSIPRGLDEVDVSTADRSLISDKKAVFVIGALDGEFPHAPVEAGVFTDTERVKLKNEFKLSLSDSVEELIATERYYAYSALTAASELLFVSYPLADMRGEPSIASDIISELELSLEKPNNIKFTEVNIFEHLHSKRSAFDYLVKNFRYKNSDIQALREYFKADSDFCDIVDTMDRLVEGREHKMNDKELAKALFGDSLSLSSSKIDTYHKCAFRYFCEYGLSVRERRKAAVDALEYGTLMHHIFECFFKNRSRDEYISMSGDEVKVAVTDILSDYINDRFGGTDGKSQRFIYLLMRISSTAVKLVEHIIEELRQSDFTPTDFELNVGEDIPEYHLDLSDGLSLNVRGSIDRVDLCESDGVKYVRVVDYKTGTKDFNLTDLLYGLNLQMFIYLYAIEKNGQSLYGETVPAGVLYMPAVSPVVSAEPGTDSEKLVSELKKQYTMKGVLLSDAAVISHMEHDGRGKYIPVKIKGDELSASAGTLASAEELGAIFRHIDILMKEMANSLYDGDVNAKPIKGKNFDGCAFCAYQSVCLHRDGDAERTAETISPSEVYDELKREEENYGKDVD